MGQINKLDWLDRLTFMEIEAICEREKRESDFLFLNVEFPIAEYDRIQVQTILCSLFCISIKRVSCYFL